MKWEMDMEQEIEAVVEKIWELHDKISDAIHATSRAYFLKSIKNLSRPSPEKMDPPEGELNDRGDEKRCGFVYVKGFRPDEDAALAEARSLSAIRSALENLEDQIEFFHTIQLQQQAERDAAIARVEQSRILLAMRLSEHQGEKHKVIEDAQSFVLNVRVATPFITPESLIVEPRCRTVDDADNEKPAKPHALVRMLISSFEFAKSSLTLERFSGAVGSAALFAVSMLALLQIQQTAHKQEDPALPNKNFHRRKGERLGAKVNYSSQTDELQYFDVYSAKG